MALTTRPVTAPGRGQGPPAGSTLLAFPGTGGRQAWETVSPLVFRVRGPPKTPSGAGPHLYGGGRGLKRVLAGILYAVRTRPATSAGPIEALLRAALRTTYSSPTCEIIKNRDVDAQLARDAHRTLSRNKLCLRRALIPDPSDQRTAEAPHHAGPPSAQPLLTFTHGTRSRSHARAQPQKRTPGCLAPLSSKQKPADANTHSSLLSAKHLYGLQNSAGRAGRPPLIPGAPPVSTRSDLRKWGPGVAPHLHRRTPAAPTQKGASSILAMSSSSVTLPWLTRPSRHAFLPAYCTLQHMQYTKRRLENIPQRPRESYYAGPATHLPRR
ncbi:hypothetical protein Purlil1_2924 [Purpureocillium lilacinum]|uniref:Uncharacterized protein n=1 Tax=Purpureocillium lilacinum TaxID=33203 RepID=A0ABR0C9E6_PURLI|nr:hypothetical protein Purlil1_2924 [Purpureocillium lilacinum]